MLKADKYPSAVIVILTYFWLKYSSINVIISEFKLILFKALFDPLHFNFKIKCSYAFGRRKACIKHLECSVLLERLLVAKIKKKSTLK